MYYQSAIREGLSLPQFSIRLLLHSYYEIWVRDTEGLCMWYVMHKCHMSLHLFQKIRKFLCQGKKKKLSPCFLVVLTVILAYESSHI